MTDVRVGLKPLLLKHYRIRIEPPREGAEGALIFTSERRRVVIGASSLDIFLERVVPLLDGHHTLEDIKAAVAGVFDPHDLENCLSLLLQHRIVEDAEGMTLSADVQERLAPQLSYLREVSPDPSQVIDRLAKAEVTVVGVGAIGAVAATALGAANVGRVRCVDGSAVSAADPYLSQTFSLDDVGRSRAEATRDRIHAVNPSTAVEVLLDELRTDEDAAGAIAGSDFVLGCLDPGLASTAYKLNRACLSQRMPWASATVSAFEGVVGPTVIPYETACFLCYQMRTVACTDDPVDTLADLRQRDERRTDESLYRENLAFGAGIVGQLLALEAFKALLGFRPATAGRIVTIDFMTCAMKQHVVLRQPSCPACLVSGKT